jgi:hypothetical protein
MQVYDLSELKKQYDDKPIEQVEADLDECSRARAESERAMVWRLFYLEKTERWRENKQYAKPGVEFRDYLAERFNISEALYTRMHWAWLRYPAESKAYGSGFVIKAVSKLKHEGASRLMKDLQKADPGRVMSAKKRNKMIEARVSPPVSISEPPRQTQTPTAAEHETIQALRAELAEKEEQIARLKAALASRDKKILALQNALRGYNEKNHCFTS